MINKIKKRIPSEIFLVGRESRHHSIKDNNHFDLCRNEKMYEVREKKRVAMWGVIGK